MIEKREFYIGGRWTASAATNDFEVIDPSNEEPCAVIRLGVEADTDAAVAAAKAAFPAWSATSKEERIALVEKILEVYIARDAEMAEAISLEMGAPIDMSRAQQSPSGTWHIKNFIRAAKGFEF